LYQSQGGVATYGYRLDVSEDEKEKRIMRKRTTTRKLSNAIENDLLQVIKAECRYKSSEDMDVLDVDTFVENLQFLCESGVFSDFVDWHYERSLSGNGEYIIDSGAMNPYSENIVVAYLRVNDGVDVEDVDKVLKIEEE